MFQFDFRTFNLGDVFGGLLWDNSELNRVTVGKLTIGDRSENDSRLAITKQTNAEVMFLKTNFQFSENCFATWR